MFSILFNVLLMCKGHLKQFESAKKYFLKESSLKRNALPTSHMHRLSIKTALQVLVLSSDECLAPQTL